jgi:hypothetical protein
MNPGLPMEPGIGRSRAPVCGELLIFPQIRLRRNLSALDFAGSMEVRSNFALVYAEVNGHGGEAVWQAPSRRVFVALLPGSIAESARKKNSGSVSGRVPEVRAVVAGRRIFSQLSDQKKGRPVSRWAWARARKFRDRSRACAPYTSVYAEKSIG